MQNAVHGGLPMIHSGSFSETIRRASCRSALTLKFQGCPSGLVVRKSNASSPSMFRKRLLRFASSTMLPCPYISMKPTLLLSKILLIKSYQIELKLRATPDSKALKEKWDLFNYHICNYTKIELGLETIFQLTLQVILVLFAKSKTRTTDELTQIFNAELSFLLVASIAWSFISNVK